VGPALVEIDRETLWATIQSADGLVVVDALPPISYAAVHLPGAINIPPDRVDALAERRIPDSDAEVVVYCAGWDCDSSVQVAERLLELGYTNVRHYAGGKEDWREGGLPLEGGRV
jgi:rhodanese-related sulfurtransferase